MSMNKYFINESIKKQNINEFLALELKKAGYSKCEMAKTPLGTSVIIYAAKPGIVIGRRGQSIRDLTRILEERFKLENPQISVTPVDIPELDPKVMVGQVASALERGIHFRRASYWALRKIMEAGALGAEIIVSGKLTTERSRYEKYNDGYLPKTGDPIIKQLRKAVAYTQLKPGIIGIKVNILPPDAKFPDKPRIKNELIEKKEQVLTIEQDKKEEKVELEDEKNADFKNEGDKKDKA